VIREYKRFRCVWRNEKKVHETKSRDICKFICIRPWLDLTINMPLKRKFMQLNQVQDHHFIDISRQEFFLSSNYPSLELSVTHCSWLQHLGLVQGSPIQITGSRSLFQRSLLRRLLFRLSFPEPYSVDYAVERCLSVHPSIHLSVTPVFCWNGYAIISSLAIPSKHSGATHTVCRKRPFKLNQFRTR